MENQVVHVAAGVIMNRDGKVLIAKRPDGTHQGGLWEFPGGKLESNEPVQDALKRELHEELGISIQHAHPLIRVHHDYPDKSVLLDVWKITAFTGEAHGKEGQTVKWINTGDLNQYDFPEANQPIVKSAQLPDRYMITGDYKSLNEAAEHLKKRIKQGIRLIQFRANYLSDDEYLAWSTRLLEMCTKLNVDLILNRDLEVIKTLSPDGIHLSAKRLMACQSRPVSKQQWFSASVHNEQELEKALRIDVDFVVVAPVLKTQTHPEAEPLGWNRFRLISEKATCPVYALGGLSVEHMDLAYVHGAQGIAAIRGLYDES
jgi:8-oxo-dGTP diphosphatase